VYHYKDELMEAVRGHAVVVCKGETGSGKTTQFPQYLCDTFRPRGLVGVTQPRRVAAVSVATRVAQERHCRVGEEVGKHATRHLSRGLRPQSQGPPSYILFLFFCLMQVSSCSYSRRVDVCRWAIRSGSRTGPAGARGSSS
jgi:hypothetical protein